MRATHIVVFSPIISMCICLSVPSASSLSSKHAAMCFWNQARCYNSSSVLPSADGWRTFGKNWVTNSVEVATAHFDATYFHFSLLFSCVYASGVMLKKVRWKMQPGYIKYEVECFLWSIWKAREKARWGRERDRNGGNLHQQGQPAVSGSLYIFHVTKGWWRW